MYIAFVILVASLLAASYSYLFLVVVVGLLDLTVHVEGLDFEEVAGDCSGQLEGAFERLVILVSVAVGFCEEA